MRHLYSHSLRLFTGLMLIISLNGCSQLGGAVLGTLTGGGGPNVAANVQAAKTATQTLGKTEVQDIRAETVNQTTTNVTEIEWWVVGLLVVMAVIIGSLVDDIIRQTVQSLMKRWAKNK